MRAVAVGLTDVGLQRDHNEDSFAILQDHELYIVADGMGGHRAGDVASKLATEAIVDFFRATAAEDFTWPFHFDSRMSEEENRLLTGIKIANRQIVERSSRSRECHGMGTTVVGALFSGKKGKMYIGHVGDSRAYRVRAGEIRQMTRDHSLVNDYLLAMPELTDEQKSELPKNVITRALGMQEHVSVDLQGDDVSVGDCYVLCSDGLSGMIEDAEILDVVSRSGNIDEACRRLIALANEHGGEDNITAVLVRIVEEPGGEKVSLSDTLPTPLTAKLRQSATSEAAPATAPPASEPLPAAAPAADGNADTPPAPDQKPKE
ncbi:MAG TPA: Stp1/IreP family PP2C-type Ser/Thr phosphatase [Polyangiaceae bacterium]|nr:Stp1/IreP family PP2C-type Ser/Thr phosphatase [Polyangiaceae bacterium]